MVHDPLMILSEWREFPSTPCLVGGKKTLMTARVSMLLKSRASPDMFPFSLCSKKILAIRHMNTPLSNDTIDSVLRHWEVGRAKDLSPPLRTYLEHSAIRSLYQCSFVFSLPSICKHGCNIRTQYKPLLQKTCFCVEVVTMTLH